MGLMECAYRLYSFIVICILRVMKLVLRKLTRLTELQRAIYGELRGSRRIKLVEKSLQRSRSLDVIQQLVELERGVNDGRFDLKGTRKALVITCSVNIARTKSISTKSHARFINGLHECLEVIYAVKCLNVRLELLRSTPYSHDNPVHERMLIELWDNLKAPETLSARKTRQWQEIGFQGNDPATDFRGAGVLALEAMVYMTRAYPALARQLLANSLHPLYSYPFALLSIQMTYMAAELTRDGYTKTHFYNRVATISTLDDRAGPNDRTMWGEELVVLFYELCCCFMSEFDQFWFACKPKDIMEFGRIRAEFDKAMKNKLRNDTTCFLMEIRTI